MFRYILPAVLALASTVAAQEPPQQRPGIETPAIQDPLKPIIAPPWRFRPMKGSASNLTILEPSATPGRCSVRLTEMPLPQGRKFFIGTFQPPKNSTAPMPEATLPAPPCPKPTTIQAVP